jgi:choline dehydrogenase-like flavoprotein
MDAEKALGIPIARDQANGNPIGSYWTPNSLNPDGEVRSYAKNYNELAKNRSNYHLLNGQIVTKINIAHGKATGVSVSHFLLPPVAVVLQKSIFPRSLVFAQESHAHMFCMNSADGQGASANSCSSLPGATPPPPRSPPKKK